MGSIDPQSPFWCCYGDCNRRGWVGTDDGFLCCVCDQRAANESALDTLCRHLSKGRTTRFEALLSAHELAMQTMEFVFGDGWAEQCPCRTCQRGWLNLGWICPVDFNKRWYLHILDRMFARAGYLANQLRVVNWDILVVQLHGLFVTGKPIDTLDDKLLLEMLRACPHGSGLHTLSH